jgi:predicted nucleic acid-binding protein
VVLATRASNAIVERVDPADDSNWVRDDEDEPELDSALSSAARRLDERVLGLVIKDIRRRDAAFEIPTDQELAAMPAHDLFGLARTVGVQFPVLLTIRYPW